jgi:hypothetical protein
MAAGDSSAFFGATGMSLRLVLIRLLRDNADMSTLEMIERELAELPEPLQREVYDFVRFLRLKQQDEGFNGLLLSESALAKDWNTPEEDAAWQNL